MDIRDIVKKLKKNVPDKVIRKTKNIAAIDIDAIKKEKVKEAGLLKIEEDYTKEDKENLELYYKIEQGRGLHEAKMIIEREQYLEANKDKLAEKAKENEEKNIEEQKKSDDATKQLIEQESQKLLLVRKELSKILDSKTYSIKTTINGYLSGRDEFAFGLNRNVNAQPSLVFKGKIFLDQAHYKEFSATIYFGAHTLNNQDEKKQEQCIEKDISEFEAVLPKIYADISKQKREK